MIPVLDSPATPTENLPMARLSIEELVRRHDEALDLYREAYDALEVAQKAVARAQSAADSCSPGINNYNHSSAREIEEFRSAAKIPNREQYLRTANRLLDLNCWAWIVQHTRLEALMDAQAKQELERQMAYIPERHDWETGALLNREDLALGMPPLTVENIVATLEKFQQDAGEIFVRGIAKVFSSLDRRFRSHDGFKIGSRIILTRVFNEGGGLAWGRVRDQLIDVERVFTVLDGRADGSFNIMVGALQQDRPSYAGARQSVTETQYFRIRGYCNGNAHLWFLRDDLVEKVNLLLAGYYGEAIGDARTEEPDPLKAPKTEVARYFGFYPTPETVVAKVMEKAFLYRERDAAPLRILEPSAGTGNLARPMTENHRVECVEIQPHLARVLESSGLYSRVYTRDFLDLSPDTTGLYDRVVMNPPFDRERDIDHVTHALKFLKPGGRLVAVMSAGTEFRETKKSQAFRALVIDQLKGRFSDLPERSFAEVGTNCNTLILTVNKDAHPVDRW